MQKMERTKEMMEKYEKNKNEKKIGWKMDENIN